MALPILPILLIGGAIAAGIALSSGGGSDDKPKAVKRVPPPRQDKVQTAADKTLEKLRDLKAKADKGDTKARDALTTLKDLYGRLKK